ncbi:MAG: hypothetical protein EXS67_05320, partial [Candidatus Margulisbacteria bacterium]|nr:hypothetical protein [Candidatus Margulisiibacteriota bacterium]
MAILAVIPVNRTTTSVTTRVASANTPKSQPMSTKTLGSSASVPHLRSSFHPNLVQSVSVHSNHLSGHKSVSPKVTTTKHGNERVGKTHSRSHFKVDADQYAKELADKLAEEKLQLNQEQEAKDAQIAKS